MIDYLSLTDLEQSLRNKNTDMAMTILPNQERETYLKFTPPYLNNSFSLITRIDSKISSLDELQSKRIAIQRSNFVEEKITNNHHAIKLLKKDSQLDSLIAVTNGEADAAVTLLPTATYLIRQYFSDDLKVATSLPDFQANLPFSIRSDEPMLYTVILKSIEQLKPGYINGLMSNWKGMPPPKRGIWKAYISSYKTLSIAASVFAFLCLIFISYLAYKRHGVLREAEYFEFRGTLLDSIPMAISVRDLDGRFIFCNQLFYSQLRITPDIVIGKLTSEFTGLPIEEAVEQERLYLQVLKAGKPDQRQLDVTVNGVPLTLRQWDRPFTDKHGNIAGLISGYADVTADVLLLQKLRDAHESAVQANEAKSKYLAVMSHEIRTPLNAIIGLLELTIQRMDSGNDCNREDLEVAYDSSKSLVELIDDVLDLAKIESGRTNLISQRCNVSDLIHSVTRTFSAVAQQKNIYLIVNDHCSETFDISLDGGRFKQVLSNLLSNAIKFTDSGGVTIDLSCDEIDKFIHVKIKISDTGIGISENDQIELFKPFSQAHAIDHNRGGTGLGLMICRQLIEMMGGKLELHSVLGEGTQVSIHITAPKLEKALPSMPLLKEEKHMRKQKLDILLVDDHPANRLLLSQQAQFLGHTIKEAEDGSQAFLLLQDHVFNLIITDCNMPIMDGYQLSQKWREYEAKNNLPRTWILGFTANVHPEEQQRCLDAGMDGCLFKPVSLAQLEVSLSDLPLQANSSKKDWSIPKDTPILDKDSIDSITGRNEKLTQMLIIQLHTSNALDLDQLNRKIHEKQWKDLAVLAHRLKGVGRLINSTPLITATTAYENSLSAQHEERTLLERSLILKITLEKLQLALLSHIQTNEQSTTNT